MTFLIVVGISILLGIGLFWLTKATFGESNVLPLPKYRGISGVGRAIIGEYNQLPPESRPFPDIVSIIRDLDRLTDHKSLERRRHFDANWLSNIECQKGPFSFSWSRNYDCSHHGSFCEFYDYVRLHDAIEEVSKGIEAKNVALIEQNLQPVHMVEELEQRLREEAGIQREMTKMLNG